LKTDQDAVPVELDLLDLLMLKQVAHTLGFWSDADEDGDLPGVAATFRAAHSRISPEQLRGVMALAERALAAQEPPTCIQFAQAVGRVVLVQKQGPLPPLHPVKRDKSEWWELQAP
jgi:hypothetical protein